LRSIPIACNFDCGGGCALLAHMEDGKIKRITDNPLGGNYLKGCIRGYQLHHIQYHPDRLTKPLIRTGVRGIGKYREATWREALDLVAEKLLEIREKHGPESVIFLGGSGATRGALHNTSRLPKRFLSKYGGYTERNRSYSVAAVEYTTPYVLGTLDVGLDPATIQHSELIVLWGANIVDTRFGGSLESYIREARKRGVRVVGIEPRRTNTIKTLCTDWVQILPSTDTALMLGVLYELIKNDGVDRDYVAKYTYGFNDLKNYILGVNDNTPKTPEWVEEVSGTPIHQTQLLAKLLGTHHPVCLIPGLSIQRTIGGEDAVRLSIAIQAATGNLGVLGGSTGSHTGYINRPQVEAISVPENPTGLITPTYTWPDAILEGTAGGYPSDIKVIYNVGGNYIVQGSDVQKNIEAFKKVDFSVNHERFLTTTAKYCDVVLPTTTFLERYDIITGGGNFVLFSNKVHDPLLGTMNDYDIFCELAKRMGFLDEFSEKRTKEEWLRFFIKNSEIPDYDEFKTNGIYWGKEQKRVSLGDFIHDPEKHPLKTPSGRIQLRSEEFEAEGGTRIPVYRSFKVSDDYPLRLITPKSRYRIHSQNYNIKWFRERETHAAWINPRDAQARDIKKGDLVHVFSPRGVIRIEAYVTEDIMQGVICIQEGVWPRFEGDVEVNGSVNVLTSTEPTLPSFGSRTHSVIVQVEKV
jgi:anaerobic dimethyl sulfoxide reductase subunit A